MALPAEQIESFAVNVHALVDEVNRLRACVDEKDKELERQRNELIRSHAELKTLQDEYHALRTARALTEDEHADPQVKRRVAALIDKIDQTLLLLQE